MAVIVTPGSAASLAAYAATTTIPIVFASGADPIASGLVSSLNRPGTNATGVYIFQQVLEGKRLGLLHGLVPPAALIAVLLNPTNANFQAQLRGVQEAARAVGQQVNILSASTERDIDTAFETATESRAGALLVGSDPFFSSRADQVVALAARHAIPAIYEGREFAMAGGLASYGTSLVDAYRQVAIYTARILKGAKPADLPVEQLTKFELVINLKTAKATKSSSKPAANPPSSLDLSQPSRDNSSNAPLSGSRISARNSPAARAFLNVFSAAPRAASLALKASTNGPVASPSFPAAGGLTDGSLMAASNPSQLGVTAS
jgi:hypothetical protein